jgi:hypothetical protein
VAADEAQRRSFSTAAPPFRKHRNLFSNSIADEGRKAARSSAVTVTALQTLVWTTTASVKRVSGARPALQHPPPLQTLVKQQQH